MQVYFGFQILAVYFVIPANHHWSTYNCALIKVDWLAACIALRVVDAVLVDFFWRWREICTILQPMGSKGPIQ
jgi:hypothetical protein